MTGCTSVVHTIFPHTYWPQTVQLRVQQVDPLRPVPPYTVLRGIRGSVDMHYGCRYGCHPVPREIHDLETRDNLILSETPQTTCW